jgi:hypothetical protein
MNRLVRASGVAVSGLTAATATVLLLVPGHVRLEYPEATAGASGAVTSVATPPAGNGAPAKGHGLTVNGSGRASGLAGAKGRPGGSRSTGGHDAITAGPPRPAFPPFSLHLPAVTSLPSPGGTIGDPGVACLQGYVWRQAYAGDYVCVTPGTRGQAAADNAAAPGRIADGGGAYGQHTCQQGYVWRQVVPDDNVCVTPATRARAAADNAQANNRVALLRLWLSDWKPAAQSPQQNCSGEVCSTTEGGWDGPNFQVNGDHFNFGAVLLQIRRDDGTVLWSTTVTATSYPGFAGAALYAPTPVGDCSNVPGTTDNDYAIAFDTVSGHWSNVVALNSDCASF